MTREHTFDQSEEAPESTPQPETPPAPHDAPSEAPVIPIELSDAQRETIAAGLGDSATHDTDSVEQGKEEHVEVLPTHSTEPVATESHNNKGDGDKWFVEKKEGDKTWSDTVRELDQVLLYKKGRTWTEYGEQALDAFFKQMHPSMKEYTPPEPTHPVPQWWAAIRDPSARLMEGLARMPWFKAVRTSAVMAVALIPLPGFAFWNAPLIIIGGALRLRVQHLDVLARTVNPLVQGVYKATKFIVDNFGFATVANKVIDPLIAYDPIGKSIDWVRGGTKEEREQKKINKWEEAGDSGPRAVRSAEWMLFGMMHGHNYEKVLDMVERSSPRRYTKDLLENFNRPASLISLENVKSTIQNGERYQQFEETMHKAGYECSIVIMGDTLVLEIWKAGTDPHGADARESSQVP